MITLEQLGPEGLRRSLMVQEMRRRLPGPMGGAPNRRMDAAHRLLIEQEEHAELIRLEIFRIYKTPQGREAIAAHAKTTRNVLKDVVDRLSVAYDVPPVREFKSGPKRTAKQFRTILDSVQFDALAEQWSRYAFLTNVVHVIPLVVDGKLRYETILPHAAEVVIDDGDEDPSVLIYDAAGKGYDRVAVDSERFWYLNGWEPVDEFRHGYRDIDGSPLRPWIEWRVRARLSQSDYWARGVGRQLVDATLKVGRVAAHMDYVRQVNSHKLQTLAVNRLKDDVPPEQALTPERPLLIENADGELKVVDLSVAITQFQEDIDAEFAAVAKSYGVPKSAIDSDEEASFSLGSQTAVAKLRRKQVKHLRAAEIRTHVVTAIVMQAERHPLALSPRHVHENLALRFQEQTFVEHPNERLRTAQTRLSLGLVDHVQLRMEEHPDEDEETAERNVRRTIERRNEFSNLLAKHNLPADAGQDGETLAQLQGRMGGLTPKVSKPDGDDATDES